MSKHKKENTVIIAVVFIFVATGLALGLGLGLKKKKTPKNTDETPQSRTRASRHRANIIMDSRTPPASAGKEDMAMFAPAPGYGQYYTYCNSKGEPQ